MIEVRVTTKGGTHELAKIRIENLVDSDNSELGNYSIQFGVDTVAGFAIYQRSVDNFPRKRYNVLGLLKIALDTLEEKELTLDADPDARRTSDLARRIGRAMWPF